MYPTRVPLTPPSTLLPNSTALLQPRPSLRLQPAVRTLTAPATASDRRSKRPYLELVPDELGKMILDDVRVLSKFRSVTEFLEHRQGRSNFTDLKHVTHPARRLLRHISTRGAPVVLHTPPWDPARTTAAVARGPHQSAIEYRDFLREEMADMVRKAIWVVPVSYTHLTLPTICSV